VEGFESNLRLRLGDSRLGLGYARANGRYDANVDGRLDSDLAGVNIAPNRLTAFWEQNWTPQLSTRLQASHAFDRDFDLQGARGEVQRLHHGPGARYALDKQLHAGRAEPGQQAVHQLLLADHAVEPELLLRPWPGADAGLAVPLLSHGALMGAMKLCATR
jgi:hypothetical protein